MPIGSLIFTINLITIIGIFSPLIVYCFINIIKAKKESQLKPLRTEEESEFLENFREKQDEISIVHGPTQVKEKIKKQKKSDVVVFISYATKDAKLFKIEKFAEELKNMNNISDVFYWEEDTEDSIIGYMDESLGKCDVLVLFCSPNSLESIPVKKEWRAAEAIGKPIIPVFIKEDHIPTLLRDRIGVEYDTFNLENSIKSLHKIIAKKKYKI
ncbi:MAG: toll/interleukin-1 receptor domain-containing protein [Promethearchaeota archaeon]